MSKSEKKEKRKLEDSSRILSEDPDYEE